MSWSTLMNFSLKQVQGRGICLTKKSLPKSPNKKSELYNFTKKRKEEKEKKQIILDTLDRSVLIYFKPGCKVDVYMAKRKNMFKNFIFRGT